MEITTLQKRIEERAEKRLKEHLLQACNKEKELFVMLGDHEFEMRLSVSEVYPTSYGKRCIRINDEKTQKIFDAMLPRFIQDVTDEILQKIDEIDYLLENKQEEF